ncbi:MAG: hypothetical protein JOZ75_11215 [Candidatus Dormibacteraeota bacterium]|nr:hypothetical protein [Candidatus Dormibacteraeota bacterium]
MAKAPYPCGDSGSLGARRRLRPAVAGALAAVATLAVAAPTLAVGGVAGGTARPVGAVYVASNAFSGNEILTFPRYADGSLGPVEPGVPTGGLGSGPGLLLTDDPLGSQSSLLVDQDRRLLFVVNAGSNDVSVLSLRGNRLSLVDREPSDGAYPVSLALFDHTLYVINAAGNSLAGFSVGDDGHLTHLQTCALPSLPSGADPVIPGTQTQSSQPVIVQTGGQVGFSPDGTRLLVVSKEGPRLQTGFPFSTTLGPGRVDVYDVGGGPHTLLNCGHPTSTVLASNASGNGKMPFSFGWTAQGDLLLLEVFGATTSFAGGAVSSYELRHDDTLTPISTSVPSGETAPCWIVRRGPNIYVANNVPNFFTPPNAISHYVVHGNGQLDPTPSVAATLAPDLTDMAITANGRFLYQLATGSAQVWPYSIGSDGALAGLTPVTDGEPPQSGQVGIATYDFH